MTARTLMALVALALAGCAAPRIVVRVRDCEYAYSRWMAAEPVHANVCRNPAHRDTTGGRR